jgi:signal transduction histidine kinase
VQCGDKEKKGRDTHNHPRSERELGNAGDANVYRIIQELVNNALKHADANQILMQLTKTPTKVLITVEDNGKGFDLNSLGKTSGIGIANIKHRVNYLNGTIQINAKPGDGTSVNIELTV